MKNVALLAAFAALGTIACTRGPEAPALQFAVTAPAANVARVRVVSHVVNLQEPMSLSADGADVVVRYAVRGRAGAEERIDPETLDARAATAVTYAAHARPSTPAFLASSETTLDGASFFTDDASGRVLLQPLAADGSPQGAPTLASPAGVEVVGAPHVATVDGRRAVLAFFASTGAGYDLVTASIELPR
jgi:hypothetical protein